MSYERKEKGKQDPRVDFFSLNPRWKDWFYIAISILGAIVLEFTIRTKWNKSWSKILESLGENITGLFLSVGLLFIIVESISTALQFRVRVEKQTERNREIAAEIRNAIARHDTPVRLDELVEKEAFRVLQRQRPKSLFRFYKRKKKRE